MNLFSIFTLFFSLLAVNIIAAEALELPKGWKKGMIKPMTTIQAWKIANFQLKGDKVCYSYLEPYRSTIIEGERNYEPYLMVIYLNKGKFTISLQTGVSLGRHGKVMMELNHKTHLLNSPKDSYAWTSSAQQDVKIINDIITEGVEVMEIRTYDVDRMRTPEEYSRTIDSYSLKGIDKALIYMQENCKF
jgi:hypothetical protein